MAMKIGKGKRGPGFAAGPSTRRRTLPASRAPLWPIQNGGGAVQFSYASADDPWFKRSAIRALEHLTGQPRLRAMYLDYTAHPRIDETFWDAALRHLQLDLTLDDTQLAQMPPDGPLVVVGNHPFGVIDGLIAGHLISRVRNDFKILTNSVLYQAPEIRSHLLPVDFSQTREALETNILTRRAAKDHLSRGGCIVIFPAGGVSTTPSPFAKRAVDVEWKSFVAGLVLAAKADVVPVYFEGQNSRVFQVASHVSQTLRLALFFHEVNRRIGTEVRVRIGDRIPFDQLAAHSDRLTLTRFLREATYRLGEPTLR